MQTGRTAKVTIALGLCFGFSVLVYFILPSNRLRRDVEHWVHGWSWSLDEEPLRVNLQRRQDAIGALPAEATVPLIDDLHSGPGLQERVEEFIAQWRSGGRTFPRAAIRRHNAAQALGFMGAKAEAAVPELRRIATNEVGIVQMAAVASLGDIGIADPATIQTLQRLTNLANATSGFAAIALWQLQPTNIGYLDFANACLTGSNRIAAPMLSRMPDRVIALGTNAEALLPGLRGVLTNMANGYLRTFAARSIWYVAADSQPSLQLLEALTNNAPVRQQQAHELCSVVFSLSEVPELCIAATPWLKSMDVSGDAQLPQFRHAALRLVERTSAEQKPTPEPVVR